MCMYMRVCVMCVRVRMHTVVLCEASTVQTANMRTQIIPLFPGHSGHGTVFSDSAHPHAPAAVTLTSANDCGPLPSPSEHLLMEERDAPNFRGHLKQPC